MRNEIAIGAQHPGTFVLAPLSERHGTRASIGSLRAQTSRRDIVARRRVRENLSPCDVVQEVA